MFCVAPPLFLAFTLWLARGLPRPAILTIVAAAGPPALLLTLDLKSLLQIGILSDTFALIPLLRASNALEHLASAARSSGVGLRRSRGAPATSRSRHRAPAARTLSGRGGSGAASQPPAAPARRTRQRSASLLERTRTDRTRARRVCSGGGWRR